MRNASCAYPKEKGDFISDGCKVKLGDAPHLEINGAGESEPILKWVPHACLKLRYLLSQS